MLQHDLIYLYLLCRQSDCWPRLFADDGAPGSDRVLADQSRKRLPVQLCEPCQNRQRIRHVRVVSRLEHTRPIDAVKLHQVFGAY